MKLGAVKRARNPMRLALAVLSTLALTALLLISLRAQPQNPTLVPVFVDANVAPGGLADGSSWVNATPSLDNAIANALPTGELWVAEGRYVPTDLVAGFNINKPLRLYGGFLGPHDPSNPGYLGESQLAERRGSFTSTVLDADVAGNDDTLGIYADNAAHVVSIDQVAAVEDDPAVVIDGFTITHGFAANDPSSTVGGGIWCHCSNLDLTNCYLNNNRASDGGAIWFVSGCPVIPPPPTPPVPLIKSILRVKSTEFFYNIADHNGGAIYGDWLWGWAVNCKFLSNKCGQFGGAAYVNQVKNGKSFDFANGVFWENWVNSAATGSSGPPHGGALYFDQVSASPGEFASSQVVNCTFVGNFAPGIVQQGGCSAGQAIFVSPNSVVGIYNSILFWNRDLGPFPLCSAPLAPIGGPATVDFCDLEVVTGPQHNNQSYDPLFTAGSWPNIPTSGHPPTHTLPDFTLRPSRAQGAGSPCIDYGDYSIIPSDVADLDENGDVSEKLPLDLRESRRRVDRHGLGEDSPTGVDYVDQGCYERP
ncbi:MAG: hypothetical protein IPJ19_20925 [Planctomycetes bacterium]|nr:hypothetical protein [Planctomycetota bacterium]